MSISNISNNDKVIISRNPSSSQRPQESSLIVQLPKDVIECIFRYLNKASDIVHLALTNHNFCSLVLNSPLSARLWNLFLHKEFPNSYTAPKSETETFPLYQRLKRAARNMEAGKCRLQILDRHQGTIECMMIRDGNLISGSWDGTIKISDLSTGKELQTLSGHQDGIACLIALNGKLISGSADNTIKIWDPSTGKELQTLTRHQDGITCMTILDGKLISGSWDCTIKIWDPSKGKELQTLSGHQDRITCMTILDGNLISGSADNTIKIWDLST